MLLNLFTYLCVYICGGRYADCKLNVDAAWRCSFTIFCAPAVQIHKARSNNDRNKFSVCRACSSSFLPPTISFILSNAYKNQERRKRAKETMNTEKDELSLQAWRGKSLQLKRILLPRCSVQMSHSLARLSLRYKLKILTDVTSFWSICFFFLSISARRKSIDKGRSFLE